jgi:hypothetical protein
MCEWMTYWVWRGNVRSKSRTNEGTGIMTIAFDKLALVKQLEHDDAFSRNQAETLAESLHETVFGDMATVFSLKETENTLRGVVKETETALRGVVKETETALRGLVKETETALRVEIKETETELRVEIKETETALRAEIKSSESALRIEMASISARLEALEKSLRADMAALERAMRADMKVLEHALKLWVGSVAVGIVTVLGGLMTLLRFVH